MRGYKAMIKDRLVPTWELALLWCKAKTRWVDTVYNCHIKKLGNNKQLKKETVLFVTGHRNKNGVYCNFMNTITNDDCFRANNPEEWAYWNSVYNWVKWFSSEMQVMKDDLITKSKSEFQSLFYVNYELYRFLIRNIHLYAS